MKVKCPRCDKLVEWETGKWRPFCSWRCKLLDLGAWASEEYRIPDEKSSRGDAESTKSDEEK